MNATNEAQTDGSQKTQIVDGSGVVTTPATVAKQDAILVAIAALQAALQDPTTYNAITPNDSTNVTALCTKGLFVAVTGNVNITGVGGSAVSLGTQIAGTRIPGAISHVNAATLATVFGLSGP